MASLLTKWMIRSTTCAGHSIFTQRQTASPSSLKSWLLQTGQFLGNTTFFSDPVLTSANDFTIYGITSPALSTNTESPIIRSFSLIISSLKSDMDETVTPPMGTGRILATGVIEPVLPTWNSTLSSLLVACLALNLYAIAQRG